MYMDSDICSLMFFNAVDGDTSDICFSEGKHGENRYRCNLQTKGFTGSFAHEMVIRRICRKWLYFYASLKC